MDRKNLYSYTAIFDTPDEIIHAAETVTQKGYTKFDVNTPYPIHGMNDAMKLKPSKLGYFALFFGLSGAFMATLIMYWMMAIDYPLIIGGKPCFAFPAFVPVIFEVTVLSASVATVLTMLFYYFKFPNNAHPLHNTEYMKLVSSDKYGICIQADDPKFKKVEVENLFIELGAKLITPIYFDEEELSLKPKILDPKFVKMLAVTVILVAGATYFTLNKLMFMQPFNWMMEQEKVIPQEMNVNFEDSFGMRTPVEGTVARGFIPYSFKGQPELAGEKLINPLLPTEENLAFGKKNYDVYCSPCHGYFGEGDSRLRGHFPNPPSLHSAQAANWSDGRIYHIITEGQNSMPGYAPQMTRQERWATVLYIRVLQRALNAKESDLK